MAKDLSNDNKLKGDDRNLVAADTSGAGFDLEDRLFLFWKKNSRLIVTLAILIVAVILVRTLLPYYREWRISSLQKAYTAATSDSQKRTFANDHAGTSLAGLALLEVADNEYKNGDFTKAAADYEQAAGQIGVSALVNRAKLGQALSYVQAGQPSKGDVLLKAMAADALAPEALRCEAYYHLATLAAEDGRTDEAHKDIDAITTLSPTSVWAQRAAYLRTTLPPPTTPPAPAEPAASK